MVKRIASITIVLVALGLAGFFLFAPGMAERSMNRVVGTEAKVSAEAEALHRTLTIADLHGDTLLWQRDMLDRASRGHIDLPRLIDGNVALQVFSSVIQTPRGQNYARNEATDTDRKSVV